MRIFLDLSPNQTPTHRCRIVYAFRVFCAIYGHEPILQDDGADPTSADVCISYSTRPQTGSVPRRLQLGNRYVPRSPRDAAPPPTRFEADGEKTVLFYTAENSAEPDWLAEIFEWISCADEYSAAARDPVGRIPFCDSYLGRHNLDACLPYAAVAMRFLQGAICRLIPASCPEPVCPVGTVRHFVIPTHDVDFFPLSRTDSFLRVAKNAAISLFVDGLPGLSTRQLIQAFRLLLGGEDPLDQLPKLAHREFELGIRATYFFLTARRHRRDANYSIDHPAIADVMRRLTNLSMEIGLHGSYKSLDRPDGLIEEIAVLQAQGYKPIGERQHWLRFTLDRLVPAAERARIAYDTSLGWSERLGFRAGACFPFPLYDFTHERPASVMEIPMVAMDQSKTGGQGTKFASCEDLASLLATSRRFGWGGISILWHPTAFGGGQLPDEVGQAYWRLARERAEMNDTWITAEAFLQLVRERYAQVGLL